MSVLGGQPKRHANPSYKAAKNIEHPFLISEYYWSIIISTSCDWSVAIFTTSLESQEPYLTLGNLALKTTGGFFRPHSTFARLYNAAASPASRLRSLPTSYIC